MGCMSDAAVLPEHGPSYSLFIEMAMAVGTTILAMYFCQNKREKTGVALKENELLETSNGTEVDGSEDRQSEMKCGKTPELGSDRHAIESKTVVEKSSASTQTELPTIEERILWKAVVVDPLETAKRRFRTELHVDVNGVITRSESFQTEGIAGDGMHQVLAKVQ